jgi:hypothetical protein
MDSSSKKLRTVKKASLEIGASQGFFRQLLREGKLKKYCINSAVYVDLVEFERLADGSHRLSQTV